MNNDCVPAHGPSPWIDSKISAICTAVDFWETVLDPVISCAKDSHLQCQMLSSVARLTRIRRLRLQRIRPGGAQTAIFPADF